MQVQNMLPIVSIRYFVLFSTAILAHNVLALPKAGNPLPVLPGQPSDRMKVILNYCRFFDCPALAFGNAMLCVVPFGEISILFSYPH
jgi:hypothetical protein